MCNFLLLQFGLLGSVGNNVATWNITRNNDDKLLVNFVSYLLTPMLLHDYYLTLCDVILPETSILSIDSTSVQTPQINQTGGTFLKVDHASQTPQKHQVTQGPGTIAQYLLLGRLKWDKAQLT